VLELLALSSSACVAGWPAMVEAQRGLDQFMTPAAPCTDEPLTPALPVGAEFKPGAPLRTSFGEPGAAVTIPLSGFVIGLRCGPLKGARVDFWQADGRGTYDTTGFRFRGHQLTDETGRYHLETILPGAAAGRARRLNARVTVPSKPPLTTALFFPDDPGQAKDPLFRKELLMKKTKTETGAVTFNFILDL
jgi:protocatechuate 3,4-dioxygenase beta subunit